jgi:hypothetical protein
MNVKDISEQIKVDLMDMVRRHDWSYMMSDDMRAFEQGSRAEKLICEKLHILIAIHREDAEALYNEVKDLAGTDYTDYDSKGRGLKYRAIDQWFKPYIGE